MGGRGLIDRITFAGGEMGQKLVARADTAKYQIAFEKQENFVTLVEGVVTRAPGTRFVLEVKDSAQRGRLLPFRVSSSDYYTLVINGGVTRLVREGGFVQNPNTSIFEFSVPWVEADMASLRAAPAGNLLYVTSLQKPQKLTRNEHTDWTVAVYAPDSGPVGTKNLDVAVTVQASAVLPGAVTLTGAGSPFKAEWVGSVIRIDDRDLSLTPEWSASETGIQVSVRRRWNGNVYETTIDARDAGPNAPTHTEGDVSSGVSDINHAYQTWRYLHSGYGYVRIDAFTNANSVTGTILSRLPDSVTTGGSFRWYPPAWNAADGWPELVTFVKSRLGFFRGDRIWLSAVDDPDDHDLGLADDDNAIALRLRAPDASLVEIKWALPSGALILGTADGEWVLRGPNVFDPLTPKTIGAFPETGEGSTPHVPVRVDGGAMFVGKTGKRMHYGKYDRQKQLLETQEISVTARHIFGEGVAEMAWQRDPHRILWMAMADGTLASATFMPEQEIIAFARHPRMNFFVENIAAIPGVESGVDEVYMIVRRTIAGVTKRYVEQLADYFEPEDADDATAIGAWFVDCGLRVTGSPRTTITQLVHLEGQEVAVFADGAMQNRKIVVGGAIQLDRPSNDITVGLPVRGYLRDLPRNLQGTSAKQKRIAEVDVHILHAGGGKIRAYDPENLLPADATAAQIADDRDSWEDIVETGGYDYDAAPPLMTGQFRMNVEGSVRDEAQLELVCDDAMPFTLLGLSPVIEIEEDD
ncbi:hypothetical protein ONR75_24055 [Rhodopseudomonas sp. P2A-2r]|uniref:hypothetical protein n=1 Tax=Rhodopseudomonas sp. P2A-2r TaxID=2991972 RepID=UPI002234DD6B|nr:hypothetical protein [Rhodopseudomonas sp. P2A-2r]UZE47913.1 hypothetical protein ONR75_24055 [Rhodopseudomonas sp. P2A-2r]